MQARLTTWEKQAVNRILTQCTHNLIATHPAVRNCYVYGHLVNIHSIFGHHQLMKKVSDCLVAKGSAMFNS